jgi:hypothetical protein
MLQLMAVILLSLALSGCVTQAVIEDARGWPERTTKQGKTIEGKEPEPELYWWTPVTVLADVALIPLYVLAPIAMIIFPPK